MPKLYPVQLTDDQRASLEGLLRQGGLSARPTRRARTLLLADAGDTDEDIAHQLDTHRSSVERTRKRFVHEGLQAALGERPRPGAAPKLDGKQEALLVALACSPAPEGQARWTLKQLAQRLVGLEVVEELSAATVQRVLKKTRSSPGRSGRGACRAR